MKRTYFLLLLSLIAFIASLFTPVAIMSSGDSGGNFPGWFFLLLGWIGVFLLNFAWLANLIGIFAVMTLLGGQVKLARIASVIALIVACHTFFFQGIPGDSQAFTPVEKWGLGAYLWGLSLIIIAIAAFLSPKSSRT